MKKAFLTLLLLAYLENPIAYDIPVTIKKTENNPAKVIEQIVKDTEHEYLTVIEPRYEYPIENWNEHITSYFGPRKRSGRRHYENHTGVDIKGNRDDPVHSYSDGIVIYAGWLRGYGNTVVVMHQDGFAAIYAHGRKNSINVSAGQEVLQGTPLMKVGTTGRSTGYHLHFEIRDRSGIPINPLKYKRGGYWSPTTNELPEWVKRSTFSGDKVVKIAGNYLNKAYIRNHPTY